LSRPGIDRPLLDDIEHFPSNGEVDLSFQETAHKFELVLMISRVVVPFADIDHVRFLDSPPEFLAPSRSRPHRTGRKTQPERQ
jgi:hypothetical protein